MEINELNQNQYVDLFGTGTDIAPGLKFGASEDGNQADILSTTETTTLSSTDETTTISPSTDETTTQAPGDTDILGDTRRGAGRPPKVELKDMSSYFEDRFKSGKLVSIDDELPDGTIVKFIPKTADEVDEVIDIQVNHRIDQRRKEIDEKWYASKSPAWQAVAKYAEIVDDPTEVLPFLQGVKTIESVSNIDPTEAEGAEKIVRARLQQRGDEEDVIAEQIDALKTANKLISTAEKYKPLILKEEQQNLSKLVNDQKKQEAEYNNLVNSIRENAIKAIEAPIFGKTKLKQEEKQAIFGLIGHPDEETKGYAIYTAIDHMFETGNFDTLKKIALLIAKEESFINYIATGAANKAAEGLQRNLRVAGERSTGGNDQDAGENRINTVQRNQYNNTPKFGRG